MKTSRRNAIKGIIGSSIVLGVQSRTPCFAEDQYLVFRIAFWDPEMKTKISCEDRIVSSRVSRQGLPGYALEIRIEKGFNPEHVIKFNECHNSAASIRFLGDRFINAYRWRWFSEFFLEFLEYDFTNLSGRIDSLRWNMVTHESCRFSHNRILEYSPSLNPNAELFSRRLPKAIRYMDGGNLCDLMPEIHQDKLSSGFFPNPWTTKKAFDSMSVLRV